MMMKEMELVEIQIRGDMGPHTVILREKEGTRCFPIYIGPYEVLALDQSLHGQQAPRPMTHDLVLNVIEEMSGELTGVVVEELRGDTYIGKLLVRTADGETARVDARPSDSLVLASKKRVPIYAAEDVLEAASLDEDDE